MRYMLIVRAGKAPEAGLLPAEEGARPGAGIAEPQG